MNSFANPQEGIPAVFQVEHLNSVDLSEKTIPEIQHFYKTNAFTTVEYTKFCLRRIHRVNPYLECVIEVNPDALDIAAQLDEERKAGKIRGPLHGIPVLVKDIIGTKDEMQTTAGSWALLGSIVPRDAGVVAQLREAGALIIGHTNMTEWASMRARMFSDGYSARGGQTRNAYDLSMTPFGSSGGSAVSVAANIVPLSLGTETDGSIAGPAQINAVVGIKPTTGLTSRAGVIPSSESLDTVGPFGRTVLDATIGLAAIAAVDERDEYTTRRPAKMDCDFAKYISGSDVLKGAKFGLPIKGCWVNVQEDHKKLALNLFEAIKQAGAEIIEVDYPCADERIPDNGKWNWEWGTPETSEYTVVMVEAYNGMNAYLGELTNSKVTTVEELIKYNNDFSGTEGGTPGVHPAFITGQDGLCDLLKRKGKKDEVYYKALQHIQSQTRGNGIDAALKYKTKEGKEIKLDALILCDRLLTGQQIAAQAGYPTISLPIGLDDKNMPVAITLQQSAWMEATLIKWASAIENLRNEKFGGRPLPTYKNHCSKNIPIGGNLGDL